MSLDQPPTGPSESPGPAKRRNWRTWGLIALAAALLAAGVVAGYQHATQPEPPLELDISIDGVTAPDDEVAISGEWITWQPARFVDKKGGAPSDEVVAAAIADGIKNVENLKRWQICGAELKSAAQVAKSVADNVRQFPKDLPYNYDPAKEAESDAKWAAQHDSRAAALNAAVPLAEEAKIACTTGDLTKKMRLVTFAVTVNGEKRKLTVSDYDVLSGDPLELYELTSTCVSKYRERRDKLAAEPLDTAVRNDDPWNTFSERVKANSLSRYDARIELLAGHPLTNC